MVENWTTITDAILTKCSIFLSETLFLFLKFYLYQKPSSTLIAFKEDKISSSEAEELDINP